jgi:predicted transcriptional regulator
MGMNSNLPSALSVRERLRQLRPAELVRLSDRSGVPHATLMKIRTGQTRNPGIETVLQFLPHLDSMATEPTTTQA